MENLLKTIFIVIITIAIFCVLFYKIDFDEVKNIMASVNIKLFILASSISIFVNLFLGTDKWRRILKNLSLSISFKELFFIMVASNPVKFVLPFKFGEISKVLYLSRIKRFKFAKALSSVIFDKFLNLLGTIILLAAGLFLFKINIILKLVVYFIIAMLIIVTFDMKRLRLIIFNWIEGLNLKIYEFVKQLFSAIGEIKLNKKINLGGYAIFFQASELLNAYILSKALRIELPIIVILLFIPLIILIGNIPITMSGLGMREVAMLIFLAQYETSAKLLSFSLMLSFVEYVLPAFFGLFFLKKYLYDLVFKKLKV